MGRSQVSRPTLLPKSLFTHDQVFKQCAKSKFNRESINLKDLNGTLDASPHVNNLPYVTWVYNVQIGGLLVRLIFTDIVATVSQYVLDSAVFIGSGVS